MLNPEQAQERLQAFRIKDWKDHLSFLCLLTPPELAQPTASFP